LWGELPDGAVVGWQGLCAHSVATFCVATEYRALLFFGATTCRRGAIGDNATSCGLDPSRQFHRIGEHAGRQNQLEPRPAISTILILVEMSSTKFNLFQHIFNLEFQFMPTYFNIRFQRISTISTQFGAKIR
jgi:hypothetical protein